MSAEALIAIVERTRDETVLIETIIGLLLDARGEGAEIYSTEVVNVWEIVSGRHWVDRRNAFPVVQRVLADLERTGHLVSRTEPPPMGSGQMRRYYRMVDE